MTSTLPTQERVDEIARELAPDVVRIRRSLETDWNGQPAVYFRVMLSDEAARKPQLADLTSAISHRRFEKREIY